MQRYDLNEHYCSLEADNQGEWVKHEDMLAVLRDIATVRDQFAMAALQGMLARENSSPAGHPKTARGYSNAAYEFADQMLAARGVQ